METTGPLKRTLSVAPATFREMLTRTLNTKKTMAENPISTTRKSGSGKKHGFLTLTDLIILEVGAVKPGPTFNDKKTGEPKTLPPTENIQCLVTEHTVNRLLESIPGPLWFHDPNDSTAVYIAPFFGPHTDEHPRGKDYPTSELCYDPCRDILDPETGETNPFLVHLRPLSTFWVEIQHNAQRPRFQPGTVIDLPGFRTNPAISKSDKYAGRLNVWKKGDFPVESIAFLGKPKVNAMYAYMPIKTLTPAVNPDIVVALDTFKHSIGDVVSQPAEHNTGNPGDIKWPRFPDLWLYVLDISATIGDPETEKTLLSLSATAWGTQTPNLAGPYVEEFTPTGKPKETFLRLPLVSMSLDFSEARCPDKGAPYAGMTIEICQGAMAKVGDVKITRNHWEQAAGIRNPASVEVLRAGNHMPPTFVQLTVSPADTIKHPNNMAYIVYQKNSVAAAMTSDTPPSPTIVTWLGTHWMDWIGYLRNNAFRVDPLFAKTKLFGNQEFLKKDVYKSVQGKLSVNPIHDIPAPATPVGTSAHPDRPPADQYPDLIHLNEYTGQVPWLDPNYTFFVLTNAPMTRLEREAALSGSDGVPAWSREQVEAHITKVGTATLTWAVHKGWLETRPKVLKPIPRTATTTTTTTAQPANRVLPPPSADDVKPTTTTTADPMDVEHPEETTTTTKRKEDDVPDPEDQRDAKKSKSRQATPELEQDDSE